MEKGMNLQFTHL